jgi:hypothetical protein
VESTEPVDSKQVALVVAALDTDVAKGAEADVVDSMEDDAAVADMGAVPDAVLAMDAELVSATDEVAVSVLGKGLGADLDQGVVPEVAGADLVVGQDAVQGLGLGADLVVDLVVDQDAVPDVVPEVADEDLEVLVADLVLELAVVDEEPVVQVAVVAAEVLELEAQVAVVAAEVSELEVQVAVAAAEVSEPVVQVAVAAAEVSEPVVQVAVVAAEVLELEVAVAAAEVLELEVQGAVAAAEVLELEVQVAVVAAVVLELEVQVAVAATVVVLVQVAALGFQVRVQARPEKVMVRFPEDVSLPRSDHQLVLKCYQMNR